MSEQVYDCEWFIRKFKAIPDDKWTTYVFRDDLGRCCVLGHCGMDRSKRTDEARALMGLLPSEPRDGYPPTELIEHINNGVHPDYKQPTPKARILAALEDIRKAQQQEGKE